MSFRLEIVTPEAKTFSDEVEEVVLPGVEGEFGVLPGHEHLITQIMPGELMITQNGKPLYLAVGEGFVEVLPDRVSVLTDMALKAEEINEQEAEAARKRALEAIATTSQEDKQTDAALRRSMALLNVKRRRHAS